MKKVQLGFKAFDIHELICHFVAETSGCYAEQGLDVSLVDTRREPDEELHEIFFSAACGSALIRWLNGEKLKIVFVAAERPMFWLYSHDNVAGLHGLKQRRIATYPDAAPPAKFLGIVFEDGGLKVDTDVQLVPAHNDSVRLEMMQSGQASAALISTAMLPRQIKELGYRQLLCLGDLLQVPTTGLAVSLTTIENHHDTVCAMREAHRAAIRLVHGDVAALAQALKAAELPGVEDPDGIQDLLRSFFSTDGLVAGANKFSGLFRLAAYMNLEPPGEPKDLYGCIRAH